MKTVEHLGKLHLRPKVKMASTLRIFTILVSRDPHYVEFLVPTFTQIGQEMEYYTARSASP
jgi:hypothetical protein